MGANLMSRERRHAGDQAARSRRVSAQLARARGGRACCAGLPPRRVPQVASEPSARPALELAAASDEQLERGVASSDDQRPPGTRRADGAGDGRCSPAERDRAPDRRDQGRAGRAASRPRTSTSAIPTTSARRLPGLWMLASLWFRADVRGLENIPEEGAGAARGQPLGREHDAGHRASSRSPSAPTSAWSGASTSSPTTSCWRCPASASCASTARWPPRRRTPTRRSARAPRCSSTPAATTRCTGPTWESAPCRLRRPQGLHPPRARARRADRARGVDRRPGDGALPQPRRGLAQAPAARPLFRLKVLPISLALPWGLNVGDMLGHLPLPAKITIQVLQPIDLREEFGERSRHRRDVRRT